VFRTCLIRLFPLEIQILDEQFAQRANDQPKGSPRRRQ
jgi:hypothetical protein